MVSEVRIFRGDDPGKTFAVPVEPVQKTGSEVVTSEKPFFGPAAGTSKKTTGLVTRPSEVVTTGTSPVQATGNVAASLTATQPVESPFAKIRVATHQPVEVPSVKVATQPVEAPGARPVVHTRPTCTSSEEVRPVEQSLTSKKTVHVTAIGVSAYSEMDSEDDQCSEPGSPAGVSENQGELSDRDIRREEELGQELSEGANYRETVREVVYGVVPGARI